MKNKMFESYIQAANRFLGESELEDLLNGETAEGAGEELPEEGGEEEIPEEEGEEPEMIPCPDCDGEGVIVDEETGEEVECETCGGTGEVEADEQEYEFDPEEGVCPCCGAKLKCVGCDDEDAEDLEGEEDLDLDPSLEGEDDEEELLPFDDEE